MLIQSVNVPQRPFPGPGRLKCDQTQRNSVSAGQWETIFDINDGPCVVTNFWLAHSFSGKARLTPVRIYFDGHSQPDIEGLTGEIFGSGFDEPANFRGQFLGVTNSQESGESSGYNGFSGYLRVLMPYYSSIKVDIKNDSSSSGDVWMMLERMPVSRSRMKYLGLKNGMYLRTYGYGQEGWKNKYTEVTLLETSSPTILAGVFQFFNNGLGSGVGHNFKFLEGDVRIYYGGSGNALYRSSGTEDFYHSSWYFQEGYFDRMDECFVMKNNSVYTLAVSRFFPLHTAPYDENGIKLTWQVGESAMPDPGDVYTRWISWFYQ